MIRRFALGLTTILALASIPVTDQTVAVGQMASSKDLHGKSMALAPDRESASLLQLLDSAYAFRSTAARDEFFSRWFTESSILQSRPSPTNPLMAEIQAIFIDFYRADTALLAHELEKLSKDTTVKGEPDEALTLFVTLATGSPGNAQYIVVQSQMRYRFRTGPDATDLGELPTYGSEGWGPWDSLGFYVPIPSHGRKVLYLTEKYRQALEEFLAVDPPDPYIASHSGAFAGVRDRVEFLRPQVSISGLHWGGWQYLTYPVVNVIGFSFDTTQALVSFRDSWCSGGEALYVKSDGKWTRLRDVGSWIE